MKIDTTLYGKVLVYNDMVYRVVQYNYFSCDYDVEVIYPKSKKHIKGVGQYQIDHSVPYPKYLFDQDFERFLNGQRN